MFRRNDRSFSTAVPSDDEPQFVIFEQERLPSACEHSIEFWVAVRCLKGSGGPTVMQWCMICQSFEALSLDVYEERHALRQGNSPAAIPDWWRKEQPL